MSKTGKNDNGSGSVYYRSRDKRWVACVTDPITGKRSYRYEKTKNKAQAGLRDMLNRADAGEAILDVSMTVEQYASAWLSEQAGKRRAQTTVHEYKGRLERHVFPVIGSKRMDKVTEKDIEDLLDVVAKTKVNGKELSRGTVKAVKNALSAMFTDARKARLIARNPVRESELPDIQAPLPKEYPSTKEVQALLAEAATIEGSVQRELGRILLICAHTGARIGEVLAMKWDDIDLERGRWALVSTLTRDEKGRGMFGSRTKTGRARPVLLTPSVVEALKLQQAYVAYVKSMAAVWGEEGFVFPSKIGRFKNINNVYKTLRRYFPAWKYSFHDLRHWFVSTGLQSGIADMQIARMIGHESTRTTNDIYGHILEEGQETMMDVIRRVLEQ
jgi:integrase